MLKIVPYHPRHLKRLSASGIRVQRVFVEPGATGMADWDLGVELNVPGSNVGNLVVLVNGVWLQPTSVGMDGRVLQVTYDTQEDLTGKEWGIFATPTGINGAARIIVPQRGVIVAQ